MKTFGEIEFGARFFDPHSGEYFIKVGPVTAHVDSDGDPDLCEFGSDEVVELSDDVDEYEHDGQPDEAQEWYDFDPDA